MAVLSMAPQPVRLKRKALERYRQIVGDEAVAELRDIAHELRDLRLLEVSATATGGGVAELLASIVPLERDLGLDAERRVIAGDLEFFEIMKKLHNGMQGMAERRTGDICRRIRRAGQLAARGPRSRARARNGRRTRRACALSHTAAAQRPTAAVL